MRLIFIYGMPASGKLTVARKLVSITGFKLFHNHQVVDLLLSIFEFGSKSFIELREEIWLSVFDQASREGLPGMIFTFAPESTVRSTFVGEAVKTVRDAGGEVEFVELTCPVVELKRRLDNPFRNRYGKLTSAQLFDELHAGGAFDSLIMPKPVLTVDTSVTGPDTAAAQIAAKLGMGR